MAHYREAILTLSVALSDIQPPGGPDLPEVYSSLFENLLNKVAGLFGVRSYGVVGWACNWVGVKLERNKRFRKKVERIMNKTYKQKI